MLPRKVAFVADRQFKVAAAFNSGGSRDKLRVIYSVLTTLSFLRINNQRNISWIQILVRNIIIILIILDYLEIISQKLTHD